MVGAGQWTREEGFLNRRGECGIVGSVEEPRERDSSGRVTLGGAYVGSGQLVADPDDLAGADRESRTTEGDPVPGQRADRTLDPARLDLTDVDRDLHPVACEEPLDEVAQIVALFPVGPPLFSGLLGQDVTEAEARAPLDQVAEGDDLVVGDLLAVDDEVGRKELPVLTPLDDTAVLERELDDLEAHAEDPVEGTFRMLVGAVVVVKTLEPGPVRHGDLRVVVSSSTDAASEYSSVQLRTPASTRD